MYSFFLLTHSWLRWVVLLTVLVAVARSARGGAWTRADDRTGLVFVSVLDLQMLIGLVLYLFVSPFMETVREHLSVAMGNSAMRYWLVEHPFGMFVAIALAHVGRARIRKAADPRRKHRLVLIFFGLALVALLVSMPWPGMPSPRPLFRLP